MEFTTLRYERQGAVAIVTLSRPERHNAVDAAMARELPQLWQHFEHDAEARVAIMTGAGARIFCAGADLTDPPETDRAGSAASLDSIRWTSMQNGVTKPVIVAVNGGALGGGLHFVADADIVIAADTAYFSDPHVAVGFVSALEPITLARRMPIGAVMRMALTGGLERLGAQEALRLGLVDEVVSAADLLATAHALAAKIAQHSPAAVARTKKAIWKSKQMGLDEALRAGWSLIMEQIDHPDAKEGPSAFVEKRSPVWQPARDIR